MTEGLPSNLSSGLAFKLNSSSDGRLDSCGNDKNKSSHMEDVEQRWPPEFKSLFLNESAADTSEVDSRLVRECVLRCFPNLLHLKITQ